MMRGTIVIITAIFSIIFLKRKLYRHHWAALTLVFTGLALVGVAAIVFSDGESTSEHDNPVVGIILLLTAQLAHGTMFIVEEKLLGDYYLHPLKVVGYEGVAGFIMNTGLLLIFQWIPCHSEGLCPYDRNYSLEDSGQAFVQMFNNAWILILSIVMIFTIACFNAFGVATTKYGSAGHRAIIDTSRTVLIWVFFLAYQGPGHETFNFLQLLGFIILVLGALMYNEILVLPFLGFNQFTKAALSKKEKGQQLLDEDDPDDTGMQDDLNLEEDFQPSSPQKYNYQKNYKHLKDKMDNDSKHSKGDFSPEGIDD